MRALVLALLAGCGVAVDQRPVPELTAELEPPPGADDAIALVTAFYSDAIGQALPPVSVRWSSERLASGDGATVIGLHYGCGDIRITWWPGVRFSQIALAHEIAHCARAEAEGAADGAHADPLWWDRAAGLVMRANGALSLQGR